MIDREDIPTLPSVEHRHHLYASNQAGGLPMPRPTGGTIARVGKLSVQGDLPVAGVLTRAEPDKIKPHGAMSSSLPDSCNDPADMQNLHLEHSANVASSPAGATYRDQNAAPVLRRQLAEHRGAYNWGYVEGYVQQGVHLKGGSAETAEKIVKSKPLARQVEARCYAVGKYHKASAHRALIFAGLDADEARARADILPDGFPFVYDVVTGVPISQVLLYIFRLWKKPKAGSLSVRSLDTACAQAYDICDFLEHLDAYGLSYENIEQEHFDSFAENQSNSASYYTTKILSSRTIKRRLAQVAAFLRSKELQLMGTSHVDATLTGAGGRIDDPHIHPLSPIEWKALLPFLGPLPSERRLGETSILRLIAEWAVLSGARRMEIVNLRASTVAELCIGASTSDETKIITLAVTKGGRPRPLWVHADLLKETEIYLSGERAEILATSVGGYHDHLFVNARRAGPNAGTPVKRETVTKWFRRAIDSANLRRRRLGSTALSSPFVFHDLRHTYAVWSYVALQAAGVQRPWKTIQTRLGHKFLDTTERVYLAFIEDHEREISDLLQQTYAGWDVDAS